MDDVQRLLAIEAIKRLKARYFRSIDTRVDPRERGDLFTPDATLHLPEAHPEPMTLAESGPVVKAILSGASTIHHGFMPEIEILSDTTATGIWAMEDRLYWQGEREADQPVTAHGFGHYFDTYECIDGQWLIKSLKLTRIRLTKTYPPYRTSESV